MGISPVSGMIPKTIKKHVGKVSYAAGLLMLATGANFMTKSVINSKLCKNTELANNGDLMYFMPKSADSIGRAQININKKNTKPLLNLEKKNYGSFDNRITGFKFTQDINGYSVLADMKADGVYEKEIQCPHHHDEKTYLAGKPEKNCTKFYGKVNLMHEDVSMAKMYDVNLEKQQDGSWKILAKNNAEERNLTLRTERDKKSGNVLINVYDQNKKVYSYDTKEKMLESTNDMEFNSFKSKTRGSGLIAASMLAVGASAIACSSLRKEEES